MQLTFKCKDVFRVLVVIIIKNLYELYLLLEHEESVAQKQSELEELNSLLAAKGKTICGMLWDLHV